MSDKIRNVTLSFPCREEWDKFEVVPGGRLCAGCHHIVRDFRDCSMEDLQSAMKSGQRVCGRFRKDQMSPSFLKAAGVALAMITVACENEALTPNKQPATNQPIEIIELTGSVDLIEDSLTTMGMVIEVNADTVKTVIVE